MGALTSGSRRTEDESIRQWVVRAPMEPSRADARLVVIVRRSEPTWAIGRTVAKYSMVVGGELQVRYCNCTFEINTP
jgi:hypothetical protein